MVDSFLVSGLFDFFECPNQILDSGLGDSMGANGHYRSFVSSSDLFVLPLLRMGQMHQRKEPRSSTDVSEGLTFWVRLGPPHFEFVAGIASLTCEVHYRHSASSPVISAGAIPPGEQNHDGSGKVLYDSDRRERRGRDAQGTAHLFRNWLIGFAGGRDDLRPRS